MASVPQTVDAQVHGDGRRAPARLGPAVRARVAGVAGSRWAPWSVLALAAAFHMWATFRLAGSSFFYMDDFVGIQDGTSSYWTHVVRPYGGHVTFSAAALWYGLLAVSGTSSHLPYLALSVAMTVGSAVLLYRVGSAVMHRLVGVAAALWLLFLAAAFHNQLWSQAALSQLATMSLCVVLLAGVRTRARVVGTVAAALVGLGVGGLGLGVVVAAGVVLVIHRRWLALGLLSAVFVVVVVVGRVSLVHAGGGAPVGPGALLRLPAYLVAAYVGTIQASLGPAQVATGTVAVLLFVAAIAALSTPLRDLTSIATRAILVGGTYLLVTWSLTGVVRGIPDEVAAPRYLGVTGPALLIVALGVCASILRGVTRAESPVASWRSWVRARTVLAVASGLVVVAASAVPAWMQARRDASYLGTLNLGHLSAMAAGSDWIAPDFAPTGEGLTYVRESAVTAAWQAHGQPDLAPASHLEGPYAGAFTGGFLATLVEARWAVAEPSAASPSSCASQLSLDTASPQVIAYRLDAGDELRVSILGAPGVSIVSGPQTGRLRAHPLAWGGPAVFSTTAGCLAVG